MAVIYQFLGETEALPYDAFGNVVMHKFVDVADLVLNPQKLALASAPNTPLTSFAGFVGTGSDILNVFHVPAGFIARFAGMYVELADTAPTTKISLGIGGEVAGFMLATVLTPAGLLAQTVIDDAYGTDNVCGVGFVAADTIDAVFSVATAIDAKLHFFLEGYKAFDLLGADV
jgi:hypothetical protein